MKKILTTATLILSFSTLCASGAFAESFQVICSGGASYGPTDGSQIGVANPASIAQDINNQLSNLAKKDSILAVSAPMVSTGTGDSIASSTAGAASYAELVCVTVTLQQ